MMVKLSVDLPLTQRQFTAQRLTRSVSLRRGNLVLESGCLNLRPEYSGSLGMSIGILLLGNRRLGVC